MRALAVLFCRLIGHNVKRIKVDGYVTVLWCERCGSLFKKTPTWINSQGIR